MKTFIKAVKEIFLFSSSLYSQVGIGNTSPKSILDIQASNSVTPVLIPYKQ